MGQKSKWEYFKTLYSRYHKATKILKQIMLNEFCQMCRYNRKYAIRKLNGLNPETIQEKKVVRKRKKIYSNTALLIIESVWKCAGYPWSERLKVILKEWLPWIRQKYNTTPEIEKEILCISSSQIDRRLKNKKDKIKKGIYGRTKPGTLLRHQIPIRTDNFDIKKPGYEEIDTVAHCGNSADGDYAYTVNQTDIHTTWTESTAVLGKGETGVVQALDQMRQDAPFSVLAYDPDNGGEFINWHLVRYCEKNKIGLSHSRPYKKNDQAHIEQKNWTHVRKLVGWNRYDTNQSVTAMNDLYRNELRLFMNLFMPSVKLLTKKRVGSKLTRIYDAPKSPFQRLLDSKQYDIQKVKELQTLRNSINPFQIAATIEKKLQRIWKLANYKRTPKVTYVQSLTNNKIKVLTQEEKDTLNQLSHDFPGLKVYVNNMEQNLSKKNASTTVTF
jgi:hypothetical protein